MEEEWVEEGGRMGLEVEDEEEGVGVVVAPVMMGRGRKMIRLCWYALVEGGTHPDQRDQ